MQILIGKINEITKIDPNNNGFKKRIVRLVSSDNQSAFIEFRNTELHLLEGLNEGDEVIVSVQLKTSVSKKSGIKFNNIIGKSIKRQ